MTREVSPLALIRHRAGLGTIQDGADALGISRVHLAKIETGRGLPSAELKALMAQTYAVPLARLEAAIRKVRHHRLKLMLQDFA